MLSEELARLAAKATPGPYDTMPGQLVRAIRGDMAVPILEARSPFCDPTPAPTVRYADGSVMFRAGSIDAKQSRAMREEWNNLELVAALLNNLPAILAALQLAEQKEAVGTRTERDEVLEEVASMIEGSWQDVGPGMRRYGGPRACELPAAIRALKSSALSKEPPLDGEMQ